MTNDLISLRALVVSRDAELRDLFRQAAAFSPVPVEVVEAADGAAACEQLAAKPGNAAVDLAYLDGALPREEVTRIVTAPAAEAKPFSILMVTGHAGVAFATDAVAGKPTRLEESQWLLDRSMRVRLPTRVLVVDDSPTMRTIMRKTLAATRFPFAVTEAAEGLTALELVREGGFDLVFLDYNMPNFSGLETLTEFKRERRRVSVVMITSTASEALAKRVRDLGAAFLKKPFYPNDIEKVLCGYYGLRALYPKES